MKTHQISKPFVINFALIFVLCLPTVISCKAQNEPISTVSGAQMTPIASTPSPVTTKIPSTTPFVIDDTPTPTSHTNPTWTPKPTFTRRPPTTTPIPTATAWIIAVTPDLNEPECILPPDSPVNLEETKINAVGSPFCIVWLDEFDDEQGFQIHLSYFHSGERFVFEVEPNVTQLVIPENQAPRLTESLEQCINRNSFMVEVVAYWPDKESSVGSFGMDVECGGPGETPLPTATTRS